MKVAYVINQYPKVSHTFIRREILALERQKMEVVRIGLRGWDSELIDAEDLCERRRTRYVLENGLQPLVGSMLRLLLASPKRLMQALRLALNMSRGADRPWPYHLAYVAEACFIALLLRGSRAEHVHAHFGTNSAEVAMLVGLLCDISYSFTVHGPDEFDRAKSFRLSDKISRAAFVVVVSSFGRGQLLRLIGREHWSKVKVVHCGLDSPFLDVPAVPVPHSPKLVCVGRLSPDKGHLLLIEAATMLAKVGVQFELVLAGDGELRGQVERAIAQEGLAGRVRVTGWISGAEVRAEIEAARALVLPSLMEGLPVVLMEAMALRRPVLATYVAGIPELVLHGENGWLFPTASVEELAGAIKACLDASSETLSRMGNCARERVLMRHNVDREAAHLRTLLYEAVQTRRATRAAL